MEITAERQVREEWIILNAAMRLRFREFITGNTIAVIAFRICFSQ